MAGGTTPKGFGERLTRLRLERGFRSATALGDAIGKGKKWQADAEHDGVDRPSPKTYTVEELAAWERELGPGSVSYLVTGTNEFGDCDALVRLRTMQHDLDERSWIAIMAVAEAEAAEVRRRREAARAAEEDVLSRLERRFLDAGFDPDAVRQAIEAERATPPPSAGEAEQEQDRGQPRPA